MVVFIIMEYWVFMNFFNKILRFLGRVFIAAMFIYLGISKLIDWQVAQQELVTALQGLYEGPQKYIWFEQFVGYAISWSSIILGIQIIFELVGATFILFGVKVKLGSGMLAIFLILSTLLHYRFWAISGPNTHIALSIFLRNMGVLGGLLVIIGSNSLKESSGITLQD